MNRVDPFMKKVFETINTPNNECLQYDNEEKGIKLVKQQLLHKTFEGICNINFANSFYNRMKTYGFHKRRIRGFDYFFSEDFNPNDEECLKLFKRVPYKHKQATKRRLGMMTTAEVNDQPNHPYCFTLGNETSNHMVFMKPSDAKVPQMYQIQSLTQQHIQPPVQLPQQQAVVNQIPGEQHQHHQPEEQQQMECVDFNEPQQQNTQQNETHQEENAIKTTQMIEITWSLVDIQNRIVKIEYEMNCFSIYMLECEKNLLELCNKFTFQQQS